MAKRLVTFIVEATQRAKNDAVTIQEIEEWRRQIGESEADIYSDEPLDQ